MHYTYNWSSVAGFGKSLHMEFFVKIKFDVKSIQYFKHADTTRICRKQLEHWSGSVPSSGSRVGQWVATTGVALRSMIVSVCTSVSVLDQ